MHADDSRFAAHHYASRLLATFDAGSDLLRRGAHALAHPARRWAECGAMSLTGRREGPPLMCPVPLAACADGALLALQAVAGAADGTLPAGAELLAERAALTGAARNGRIAPGGACRLLDCADGRIALSLARPADWASLQAWLDSEIRLGAEFPSDAPWEVVASIAAERGVDELVERGRLLSLAIAADRLSDDAGAEWFEIDCEQPGRVHDPRRRPLVVDLSSLWAGPLCTHLLATLGAHVVKVESVARPDGARRGNPAFYDLLNHGKASVALDFRTADGRDTLQRLLAAADIVIEASRPRALLQLGIDRAAHCAAGRALTWISLTGYGRRPPADHWIAFGDDAAIAAGLGSVMHRATGEALFCSDAIADPLAGVHAALAAWWSWWRGGTRRISISLRGIVGHCIGSAAPLDAAALRERQQRWTALLERTRHVVRAPRARPVPGRARPLGADTAAIAAAYA